MRTLPAKRSVQTGGHRIAYAEAGSGDPVLLVHGITTYSFIWGEVFAELAKDHRVIALDLLGCGDSDKPLDESYALRDHATRILAFADAVGLGKFHYVGHDLGGGIGQIVATRAPERLLDLALVNTVAYDFWPVQPIIAMRTPIIRQFAMASLDAGSFRLVVRRALYRKELLDGPLMELFMAPLRSQAGRKAFLHFAKCLDNRDLLDISGLLPGLPFPVLVVRGEADPYLSAAIAARLHAEIPGSRLLSVPTGGHYLMLDEPLLLARELESFMAGRRA